jgi:hypothetical protein
LARRSRATTSHFIGSPGWGGLNGERLGEASCHPAQDRRRETQFTVPRRCDGDPTAMNNPPSQRLSRCAKRSDGSLSWTYGPSRRSSDRAGVLGDRTPACPRQDCDAAHVHDLAHAGHCCRLHYVFSRVDRIALVLAPPPPSPRGSGSCSGTGPCGGHYMGFRLGCRGSGWVRRSTGRPHRQRRSLVTLPTHSCLRPGAAREPIPGCRLEHKDIGSRPHAPTFR